MAITNNWNTWNKTVIDEFRANKGKVAGNFAGSPMVVVTTTGAKSGKPFTVPLMSLPEGKRQYVFASKGGAPAHPDWYHNIVKNPEVTVEYGTEKYKAKATILPLAKRDEIYGKQAKAWPQFGDYEKKTTRKIPVIALDPIK